MQDSTVPVFVCKVETISVVLGQMEGCIKTQY